MYSMRVERLFRLVIPLLLAVPAPAQNSREKRRSVVEFAEGSFLQLIVGDRARMVAGRINDVRVLSENDDMRQGEITLSGVRNLPNDSSPPGKLTVEFAQYARPEARIKSGAQGWNGVDLTTGTYLVLALSETPDALSRPQVTAARPVDTADDPFVTELSWCVRAERNPQTQRLAIRDAILHGHGLMSAWGHYCAGRLKRIPREDAIDLELQLLNDNARDEASRQSGAQNLELELWKAGDAGDAANQRIINAFTASLASAPASLQSYLGGALNRLLYVNAPAGEAGEGYRKQFRDNLSADVRAVGITALSQLRDTKAAENLREWLAPNR
jgi:hypothetical protein